MHAPVTAIQPVQLLVMALFAANAGADDHRHARTAVIAPRIEPGQRHGFACRDQGERGHTVEQRHPLRIEVRGGIEALHLRRDRLQQRGTLHAPDRPDAAMAGDHRRPGRRRVQADAADRTPSR